MKKYLMYLVLLFSSLFIFSNVKAESISTDFGNVQFDFTTFITENNLNDYNYYSIVMRNNQQVPVLTLYKNKPILTSIGWGITLKDSSEEPVLLYTYNFNNNTWLSATNNENGQFSSRNVIYSSNFDSVLYNGQTINLVLNKSYKSFIKDYDSNFSFTQSYNNYSATISYNNENNSIVFDNTDDNLDGSIQLTKQYWYLIASYNNYEVYLYQSDTPLYLLYNGSYDSLCLSNNTSTCHTNQDSFNYNINSGASNNNFSFTQTFYNVFNDTFSNTTSFRYLNASQRILHSGDILDSSGNIISSANVYDSVVINLVKDFGNNSFGFYQNLVNVSGVSLTGVVDSLSITCEQDKLFNNGYCSLSYDDLINHNSNISHFNNFGFSFVQLFGNNSGYLDNNRYYLYSFRLIKPFTPQVGNIFINTLTNNPYQVTNISNVYLYDGGSYTDYVIKFKIENSSFSSSSDLNDIRVVFRDSLDSYYSPIPDSFNFSVYRSFKLQYFTIEPTSNDIQNFISSNDLSVINGVSSQSSFFTDTNFNTYGFGGIITAPFRILYAIQNYNSCSDITIPFPHGNNQNITLKCVRQNVPSSINPLISILQIILSGIISYRIAVGVLNIIKDLSSPDDANIEVVDL